MNSLQFHTATGAMNVFIESGSGDDAAGPVADDLGYWTGLCESYQPEWFPLAAGLPAEE